MYSSALQDINSAGQHGTSIVLNFVAPTEYTEWQWPLSGVHSIMMEKLAQAGKGAGGHAHPLLLYLPSHTKLWC
jgi:hypothetical protein